MPGRPRTARPRAPRGFVVKRALTGWGACTLLVGVSFVVHAIAAWGVAAPWIVSDEPTYGMVGRSLWETGKLTILGVEAPFYGIVYPAFVGLPLSALGAVDGIRVLQVLQPLVMSSAGFLVFAWARRLVSPRHALVAVALTLAVPAFAYSGLLMTEVAFYPIATLALLTMTRALEAPTLERQAVAVATILLASLTRLQGLALLPVLVTAVGVAALFERSLRLVRRFALALVLLAIAGTLLVGLHLSGGSHDMLGAYTTTARSAYQLGPALKWTVWHAGGLFLLVAGAPLLATAILATDAARGRERSPTARALLAVSLAYVVWSVVEVGLFASRFSGTLLERNLITVAPPLFIGFALWLERGMPRPQPSTYAVCALVIAPALALPAARLTDPAAAPQAFTALAFGHVLDWSSATWTRAAWIAGIAAVSATFLLAPRRRPLLLPVITFALLAGASALASTDVNRLSGDLRRGLFDSAEPGWVDRAADGPVTYLYDGSYYWNGVWIYAFWNPRIDQVAALPGPQPGTLPPHEIVSPRFDGQLFTTAGEHVRGAYVLASQRMTIAGAAVQSVSQPIDGTTLTLWKIDPPARLTMLRTGFQPNGDFSGHAQIDVFDCKPGALNVTLLGKDGSPVTLRTPGVPPRRVAPGPRVGSRVVVPAQPDAVNVGRCTFSLETPGLVGSTVISFEPESR